jgi:hypothetical protein
MYVVFVVLSLLILFFRVVWGVLRVNSRKVCRLGLEKGAVGDAVQPCYERRPK